MSSSHVCPHQSLSGISLRAELTREAAPFMSVHVSRVITSIIKTPVTLVTVKCELSRVYLHVTVSVRRARE